ncbi:oligosaccharide flippase family protein [Pararcticibacter amylolyticus]|uniref:Na+-driven multidrug efflux pump n=1 Tax=Pararcticibacter amylolyticus TaxID=2173175 RepID=A0A2U2PBF6_9SPHI|nr:oligosaccharide flippase family protein [Pararcticibacter amylolyticus]PWG78727.1 hypothetical protein DDR33_21135 [Pararcticibacter amylolyticus]
MKAANRIAVNTGISYARMLITMVISLYSTRIVLNSLGSLDYGIFNLIAGIIAMLSFLNTAMATSTQRYLSYYQGKSNMFMQKKVFTNSLIIHIIIGLLLVVILEILGWAILGFLNIPDNRMAAAQVVYHYMTVTVFFTVVAVPFNGLLIAHENMIWVAVVNIIETILKLLIAILLTYTSIDKLMLFGGLTALLSVVSLILYASYCFFKYEDCTISGITRIDKKLSKELTSFAGWNLFGSICGLGKTQGIAVLLNIFLGAVVNAAYGIANQVSSQLTFFSVTLLRAVNPQIMRSEGASDRNRMLRLSMVVSKFSFFLMVFFTVPVIFEMKAILTFWLKNVPEYTEAFCNLVLISILLNQLTIGLQSAVQAIGEIKMYQVVVGGVQLLNLPVAYILLYFGYSPQMVLLIGSVIEILACGLRLLFLKRIAGLSLQEYTQRVFLKEIVPVCVIVLTSYLISHTIELGFRFIFNGVISCFVFSVSIYFFGLCEDEKALIDSFYKRIRTSIIQKVRVSGTY